MALSPDFAVGDRMYALEILLNCDLQVKRPDARVKRYLSSRLGQSPSACLPLRLLCWFTSSVFPFFTGLSSSLSEVSVRSAVFEIQFNCLMQNIPGNNKGSKFIFVITHMCISSGTSSYISIFGLFRIVYCKLSTLIICKFHQHLYFICMY